MTELPALFRWMLKRCGLAGLVAFALALAATPPSPARADAGDGAQYTALAPLRLLDTRSGIQAGPGRVIEVQVAGPAVPATAVAVNVNVVATGYQAPGYLTIYPAGTPRPQASALNYSGSGAISNAATVQIGAAGRIAVWASAATDVVVDLSGYYGPAAAGSGLFEPMVATRVLDTRTGLGSAPPARLQPGQPIVLSLGGQAGVPQNGAGAAVLSLTAVSPSGSGFLTVWAAGGSRPPTSDLNFQAGQVVSNRVNVRLGFSESLIVAAGGSDTDVVADLEGWYTDGSNPQALGATFHPLPPARILDSRIAGSATGLSFAIQVAGLGGAPAQGVAAVAMNLTTTLSSAPGVLTLYPDDSARPLSSVAQYSPDQDRAQAVTTRVSGSGRVAVYLSRATQLVADLSGWFGPIQPPTQGLVPGQPIAVTAALQGSSMLVTWQPPAAGPVASYAVTASDGTSQVVPGSQLQALFSGLRLGLPYTFTVIAVGPIGSGPASTPTPPQTIGPAPGLLTFAPQLAQLVQSLPGVVSVAVREIGGLSPQGWSLGGQQDYDAASTYKLIAILAEAQAVFAGLKSDQDQVCFQDSDYEEGPYGDYSPGSCFAIAELAARAGIHSDNTAGHMLVRDLGGTDALNAWTSGLGAVNPRFHDPNVTTADDLAAVLVAFAQGRITGPAGQAWAAQFLSHSVFEDGIPAGPPAGTAILHKVGFRDAVVNDAGWIRTGAGGGYVLVTLTDGSADGWSSIAAISQALWSFESKRATGS